jgi:hypothetical protein
MKPLNMHYAHYHRKKNGLRGPLFMDRHCGDAASDARKALAYIAAKKFRAPLLAIADYLGVGRTAASAMSRSGREIVKKYNIVIYLNGHRPFYFYADNRILWGSNVGDTMQIKMTLQ